MNDVSTTKKANISRCRRCHRRFMPTKEGQEFGPKCASIQLKNYIEVKNTDGEVVAVIV